jgi:hypothetical protein
MATEDDVRRVALGLPDVSERLSYGTPAWFVGPNLFVRIRDTGDLMARTADEAEKRRLVDDTSGHFFTTPHFDGYAAVCVHLGRIDAEELGEIVTDAWRARAGVRRVQRFDADV